MSIYRWKINKHMNKTSSMSSSIMKHSRHKIMMHVKITFSKIFMKIQTMLKLLIIISKKLNRVEFRKYRRESFNNR